MLAKLLLLIVIIGFCAFWWRSRAIAELAKRQVQKRCQELGLQLLEDSVYLSKLWLARSLTGSLQICRRFDFEFSTDGFQRYKGHLLCFGTEVQRLELPPYPDP